MDEQGGGFGITPLQGTYIIGAANALFATVALGTISCFGRRTLYIAGQFFMSAFLFFCGYCVLKEWNLMSFIFINLFIVAFQLS